MWNYYSDEVGGLTLEAMSGLKYWDRGRIKVGTPTDQVSFDNVGSLRCNGWATVLDPSEMFCKLRRSKLSTQLLRKDSRSIYKTFIK